MTLSTTTLNEFVDLTRKEFIKGPEMVGEFARQLYMESPYEGGESKRFDEVDVETYADDKDEGADAVQANAAVGYNVTMTYQRIAKEIVITWEMRTYNRYRQAGALVTNLAHFCPQRRELDLTHRLTFVSSTSYTNLSGNTVTTTGGDGLAIASTSHTLSESSSTWSNRLSGDPAFSKGGLEAAEELANTNILSNYGERRTMRFNTIVSGDDPNTVNTIKEYINSTADVTGSNSGVFNVYRNKYRHLVLPQLATTAVGAYDSTKKRWWFLAAIGNGAGQSWNAYLTIVEPARLKVPMEGNNGEDVHNDNWTFGARHTYGMAIVSGRGLIASLPTS